jgi:hypothetical protein
MLPLSPRGKKGQSKVITMYDVQQAHPDTRHMFRDPQVANLLRWMGRNLTAEDFADGDDYNMTAIAEATIWDCPELDEDDPAVWESDSGGVWDAAYIYSLWAVMSDEEREY